jgi:hypothetical protein
MNHSRTPPKAAAGVISSSPPFHLLSGATCEGSDFIQRSAERREAFARAHNSLICDSDFLQTSSPVLPTSLNGKDFGKKKLQSRFCESDCDVSRSVRFGCVDVQSITPRSDKAGAIGLCIEQQGYQFVVRSLNADGPAAADGRIVPGDLLIAGLRYKSRYCCLCSECIAVNGLPVSEFNANSLGKEIAGDVDTYVDLTFVSCWYVSLEPVTGR